MNEIWTKDCSKFSFEKRVAGCSKSRRFAGLCKLLKLLKLCTRENRRNSLNRPRPTIQSRSRTSENVHCGAVTIAKVMSVVRPKKVASVTFSKWHL
jgi:hypothetical protein